LVKIASHCKKPDESVIKTLVEKTLKSMVVVNEFKEKNKFSKNSTHLNTVASGVQALEWVVISPTPLPHVKEIIGSSEFYSNKLLRDFKGKDQVQIDWVNAFNGYLKGLMDFIKQYHTTGLSWNPNGSDASSFTSNNPPPPPPPTSTTTTTSKPSSKTADPSKLFSEINKGEGITTGLKKVTNDMKSKNLKDQPTLTPVTTFKPTPTTTTTKPESKDSNKPPRVALDGKKWVVEYQKDKKDIVITDTNASQVIYIYRCSNSTVQVKGKVNAISVDDCSKTSIVFDSVLSSFEVVNCKSIYVQTLGSTKNISIDTTSGCQIFLSKDSLDCDIVTSKSSEMNVMIPGKTESDDMVELSIPEQYISKVKNGKLITETTSHI